MANPSEAIPMPFPGQSSEEKGKRKKKDKGNRNTDGFSNETKTLVSIVSSEIIIKNILSFFFSFFKYLVI